MYRNEGRKPTAVGALQTVKCAPLYEGDHPARGAGRAARVQREGRRVVARDLGGRRASLAAERRAAYLEAAVMSLPTPGEDMLAELASIKQALKQIDRGAERGQAAAKFEGQGRMSLQGPHRPDHRLAVEHDRGPDGHA